jgi:Family of unknown function (DUF6884)
LFEKKGVDQGSCSFALHRRLVQKNLAYAERTYDHSVVLSAKYGLLELDDMIEPYEQTLERMSASERQQWSRHVTKQIKTKYPDWDYVYLTGQIYLKGLPSGEEPMKGLDYGFRQQWLKRHLTT